jgi:tetratricopeptide (TPR) repeat protein
LKKRDADTVSLFFIFTAMKNNKLILMLVLLLTASQTFAQSDTDFDSTQAKSDEMEQAGRNFMLKGDYANAILVLDRGTALYPENIEIIKDLAMSYYLQKDNNNALNVIKPLIDRVDADDQAFQIAGDIYQALRMNKDCEKLYQKGLKKFPDNGPLYNELGELLWNEQDDNSIKAWENGIKVDPSYSKNYYNATRYYYYSGDNVWTILYGETYINMDPSGSRTAEIKTDILEAYKKLFSSADITKNNKDQNAFVTAYLSVMNKESNLATLGITPESLTMIRTRFVLDWFQQYGTKFPFRLFDWQRQLSQQGMFDAYNQWIFATVQNLPAYQTWVNAHYDEYETFGTFQKGRIYKVPTGQYYK